VLPPCNCFCYYNVYCDHSDYCKTICDVFHVVPPYFECVNSRQYSCSLYIRYRFKVPKAGVPGLDCSIPAILKSPGPVRLG